MLVWIKNPKLIWHRFQFVSGLIESRLVRLTKRPAATYRAVAFGVPEESWSAFESAYPEYEIIFARHDITAKELRVALATRNTVLLAFEGAPQWMLRIACRRLNVPIFHASFAPLPILVRGGEIAQGFCIDSMGDWQKSKTPTELSVFLENFDISELAATAKAARTLLASSDLLPTGTACLILPSVAAMAAPQDVERTDVARLRAIAVKQSRPDQTVVLHASRAQCWAAPEAVLEFIKSLQDCETVIVHDHPLGLLAMALGRQVVVSGQPFWAGFGLTQDLTPIKRRRNLAREELLMLLVFVLCRYVNEDHQLIDPVDGWAIPGQRPEATPATRTTVPLSEAQAPTTD